MACSVAYLSKFHLELIICRFQLKSSEKARTVCVSCFERNGMHTSWAQSLSKWLCTRRCLIRSDPMAGRMEFKFELPMDGEPNVTCIKNSTRDLYIFVIGAPQCLCPRRQLLQKGTQEAAPSNKHISPERYKLAICASSSLNTLSSLPLTLKILPS